MRIYISTAQFKESLHLKSHGYTVLMIQQLISHTVTILSLLVVKCLIMCTILTQMKQMCCGTLLFIYILLIVHLLDITIVELTAHLVSHIQNHITSRTLVRTCLNETTVKCAHHFLLTVESPRLESSSFIRADFYVIGSWNVTSFPLPNILHFFQYLNSTRQTVQGVYHDYTAANMSYNHYTVTSHSSLSIIRASDDRLTVKWKYPFHQLFSMQLIAISFNSSSQAAQPHPLYVHTGNVQQEYFNNYLNIIHYRSAICTLFRSFQC